MDSTTHQTITKPITTKLKSHHKTITKPTKKKKKIKHEQKNEQHIFITEQTKNQN